MPAPLLLTLSAAARAAYPVIKAGVARGLSANVIGRTLKASGMGIRRQTLLDIVAAENNTQRIGAALKFLAPNRMPSLNRLPRALTRLRRQYSFTVRVVGQVIDTGMSIAQTITISSNTIMTRAELERMAEAAVTDNTQAYGIEVTSALLTSGMRAGEAGTL